MREITLYPGESITIGDTTIKAAHRGGDLGSLLRPSAHVEHPPAPQMPQQIPGTAIEPGQPRYPHIWASTSDGRCPGQTAVGANPEIGSHA